MKLEIDPELLNEIRQYLGSRAAQRDSEAAQLLMLLKDAELGRNSHAYRIDTSQTGWYNPHKSTDRGEAL